MAEFSQNALRAIESFAASMQLPARPGRDGCYTFVFDRSGTFSLTPSQEGTRTLMSLARKPIRLDLTTERKVLQAGGLDPTTSRFVHAGLAPDGSIVFAVSMDDADLDLPAIESCLQQLIATHDGMG